MFKWFTFFLLLATTTFGWEAKLSVDPQIARVGQQVTVTLSIEGLRRPSRPNQIYLAGVRTGPFSSQTTERQFINGKYRAQVKYSCALIADQTGNFELPLSYTQKGETKQLTTTLQVINSSDSGGASSIEEMFFAKLTTNTSKAYVHQPFELALDIYTIQDVEITDRIGLSNMPAGLEELKWPALSDQQRILNNKIYTVHRYRCTTQAITAGNFHFNPSVTVQAIVGQDRFFGRAQTRSIPLTIEPFELNVMPLPTKGKPAAFSEGVGTFNFTVENIPEKIMQGDPITVRMRLRGEGNLRSIKAPVFTAENTIKTYESSRTAINEYEAVFEQVIMLNDSTLRELPAVNFSYFNPKTEKYESITCGPFPITVTPNGSAAARVVTDVPSATAPTKILGQDIIYLKPLPQKWSRLDEPFWYTRKLYLSLLPLPALLAALIGFLLRKVRKLHADPSELRKRGAAKISNPALKAAEQSIKKNDSAAFLNELWQVITHYFSAKLNLGAGEISEQLLIQKLQESGLPATEITAFKTLIQTCEQSRYGMTPKTNEPELHQMLATVNTVIKHAERKLK